MQRKSGTRKGNNEGLRRWRRGQSYIESAAHCVTDNLEIRAFDLIL